MSWLLETRWEKTDHVVITFQAGNPFPANSAHVLGSVIGCYWYTESTCKSQKVGWQLTTIGQCKKFVGVANQQYLKLTQELVQCYKEHKSLNIERVSLIWSSSCWLSHFTQARETRTHNLQTIRFCVTLLFHQIKSRHTKLELLK